jgi:hypothetical protein
MEKNIKIVRPSGEDNYKVLSAFESNGNVYVVVDSKLKDANQNTITFISKENNNTLEYIDGAEWDQVKKDLINIVKGNNDIIFKEPKDNYQASENIGHTIALKDAHVKALTDNYKLPEIVNETNTIAQEVQQGLNSVDSITLEQPVETENTFNQPQPSVLENAIGAATDISDNSVGLQQPIVSEEVPVVQTPEIIAQPEVNLNNNIVENPIIQEQPVDNIVNQENITSDNIIPENNTVELQQPETPVDYENISVEEIKNKIISLCDLLVEKQRKIEEKEQMINAKLEVANRAFENAQVVNQMNNENIQNDNTINIADYQPIDNQEQTKILA